MKNKKSLYRIYRPKNLDEVAGHQGIKEILISQIRANNFGHALLFSGQRGTGKTSIAKIFSKIVNCQNLVDYNPCDQCISCKEYNNNSHQDIFEIDAASNNGVEEIRNIKANTATLPAFSKYKVYIIDEVHMLSNSAFNALLKTLEEPPKHILFILATTEFSKIPATIISRCQLFNFKKIAENDLKNKIKEISLNEGKEISTEALDEIYYMCEGSLRDALNYLEQSMVIANEQITIEHIKKIFYVSTKQEKLEIIKNILNNNSKKIIEYFEKANSEGIDFQVMCLGLIDLIKEIIIFKLTKDKSLINLLNIEEANFFDNYDEDKFFKIADSLADVYQKTKNSNINFQYILINLLNVTKLSTLISVDNQLKNFIKNESEIKNEDIIHEDYQEEKIFESQKYVEEETQIFKNNLEEEQIYEIPLNQKNEPEVKKPEIYDLPTSNVEKEKTESSKLENIVIDENTDLLKLKLKLLLEEKSKWTKEINFSDDEILSILLNADKNKRSEFENKLETIWNDNELLKKFICLYQLKIPAASSNGFILLAEDRMVANWVNNKLTEEEFRKKIFNLNKQELIILCIDKKRWAEIKIIYMERKKRNTLNSIVSLDPSTFYINLKTKLISEQEEDEYLKRAKEILGENNIKVID